MRVLVAGATSVPGIPLLRELNCPRSRCRRADPVSRRRRRRSSRQGAKPVVADVFDAAQIDAVVADIAPEVVVSAC